MVRALETAARRRRLVDAARELAASGGYDAVQMRDVAANADVALGTLYRQYSSKDQLLLVALAEQAHRLQERLASRPPEGGTDAERVGDVLRRACAALERRPRETAAMVTALSSPDPAAAEGKQEVFDALGGIIAAAVGDGRAVEPIARTLGHVWFSALAFWVGGLCTSAQMTEDLEAAALLLLAD